MNQKFSQYKADFFADRLFFIVRIFLLLTVASTFLGSLVLAITVPLIGELFPFRVLLPITALLYLIWALKGNDHPWRDSSALEKWVYILIGSMIVYGAVSLIWVVDFRWSFRRLFNLCLDLTFFFLLLRLCRNKKVLRSVIVVAAVGLVISSVLGVYETFNHGIVNDVYDNKKRAFWLLKILQYPVVTASNTNDYTAMLLFLGAVFLAARSMGVFGEKNRIVRYAPVALMPLLFYLVTISGARLNIMAFWILLIFLIVHDLIRKYTPKWTSLVTIVLLCSIFFCNQYRFIVPPVQKYIAKMKEYYAYQEALKDYNAYYESLNATTAPSTMPGTTPSTTPGTTPPPPTLPETPVDKPNLDIGDQNTPALMDELFDTNEDGEKVLHTSASAGARLALLLHSFRCFLNSYGLGVGLGNTEVLAAQMSVVDWGDSNVYNIHCFIVRIVADYGIFVLIPLCAIVFLLLLQIWKSFRLSCKTKDRRGIAQAILFLGCVVIFPVVSTASSDAQDSLAMWLYLAYIVLFAEKHFYSDNHIVIPQ